MVALCISQSGSSSLLTDELEQIRYQMCFKQYVFKQNSSVIMFYQEQSRQLSLSHGKD